MVTDPFLTEEFFAAALKNLSSFLILVRQCQNKKPISSYYLLHAVLAEFNLELGNLQEASDHLLKALELTQVEMGTRIPNEEAEAMQGPKGPARFAVQIGLISKTREVVAR